MGHGHGLCHGKGAHGLHAIGLGNCLERGGVHALAGGKPILQKAVGVVRRVVLRLEAVALPLIPGAVGREQQHQRRKERQAEGRPPRAGMQGGEHAVHILRREATGTAAARHGRLLQRLAPEGNLEEPDKPHQQRQNKATRIQPQKLRQVQRHQGQERLPPEQPGRHGQGCRRKSQPHNQPRRRGKEQHRHLFAQIEQGNLPPGGAQAAQKHQRLPALAEIQRHKKHQRQAAEPRDQQLQQDPVVGGLIGGRVAEIRIVIDHKFPRLPGHLRQIRGRI